MRLLPFTPPRTVNVYLITTRHPSDDVRVRQAFSWAVDREDVGLLAYDGRANAAPSWLAWNAAYPEARRVVDGTTDYAYTTQKRDQNDWEGHLEVWTTFGDPAAVLTRLVASDGDYNLARLSDPETDAIFSRLAGRLDPEERRQVALRVNERLVTTVPFIPTVSVENYLAAHRTLHNLVPHPIENQSIYGHPDLWAEA